jgi:hypothetical protein
MMADRIRIVSRYPPPFFFGGRTWPSDFSRLSSFPIPKTLDQKLRFLAGAGGRTALTTDRAANARRTEKVGVEVDSARLDQQNALAYL